MKKERRIDGCKKTIKLEGEHTIELYRFARGIVEILNKNVALIEKRNVKLVLRKVEGFLGV